jgi:hypothetical protein
MCAEPTVASAEYISLIVVFAPARQEDVEVFVE